MPQDDFSPHHPLGLPPDLDACLRNIQRWIIQQGPKPALPSTAKGIAAEQGQDDSVGQFPEARIVWDTQGGHNHAAGNSRAVPLTGDASGTNQAAVVDKAKGVDFPVPVSGDDRKALRYLHASVDYVLQTRRLRSRSLTTTATLTGDDEVGICDATAGAFTVNLPPAASFPGIVFDLKKIDASANAVTVDPDAAETVDGAATTALSTQWQNITVFSTGSAWLIL